jgi:hypothetical protein
VQRHDLVELAFDRERDLGHRVREVVGRRGVLRRRVVGRQIRERLPAQVLLCDAEVVGEDEVVLELVRRGGQITPVPAHLGRGRPVPDAAQERRQDRKHRHGVRVGDLRQVLPEPGPRALEPEQRFLIGRGLRSPGQSLVGGSQSLPVRHHVPPS